MITYLPEHNESDFSRNVPSEYDSCGVGFVASSNPTRENVRMALNGLCAMSDRSGVAFGKGDGAGVIFETENTNSYYQRFLPKGTNIDGDTLSVGMVLFDPKIGYALPRKQRWIAEIMRNRGIVVHGWREMPTVLDSLPQYVIKDQPWRHQIFYSPKSSDNKESYRRKLFLAQQVIEDKLRNEVHVSSLSPNTTVYKAVATPQQLLSIFPDLLDENLQVSQIGFHGRMSTNTRTTESNTQPGRLISHNGELNTIDAVSSAQKDFEIRMGFRMDGENSITVAPGKSDSHKLDGILQMLMNRGTRLPEALRWVMLPAPDDHYSAEISEWHQHIRRIKGPLSAVQGPAAIVGVTGHHIVIAKDPQDLRTFWICETRGGQIVGSSEIGAPRIALEDLKAIYQLKGGEIALVEKGRLILPHNLEEDICRKSPLKLKGNATLTYVARNLPEDSLAQINSLSEGQIIRLFNQIGGEQYVVEIIKSLTCEGKEPIKGMGDDRPLACLSPAKMRIADYFAQTGAIVTNPPIDSIRESGSFNLTTYLGRPPKQINSTNPHEFDASPELLLDSPFINPLQMQQIETNNSIKLTKIDTTIEGLNGSDLEKRLDEIIEEVIEIAEKDETPIIIFSDRACSDSKRLFIPPVFIAAAVNKALSKRGIRDNVKLVFDTADAMYGHDMALLLAHGADAVNPYLLWELVASNIIRGTDKSGTASERITRVQEALVDSLMSIMSKMGISDINGYRNSVLFEAVGIDSEVSRKYISDTVSRISGIDFADIAEDQIFRRDNSGNKLRTISQKDEPSSRRGRVKDLMNELVNPAKYNPALKEQLSAHFSDRTPEEVYKELTDFIDSRGPVFLRDLLDLKQTDVPLELDEIEDIGDVICKTFRGSAMSDGALGLVAHCSIAAAFNELAFEYGPRDEHICTSNSGEGGEDHSRYPGGQLESANSKSKQIASGRFGVNAYYIISVGDDGEICIKIGQGAKPFEGGHVKGKKLTNRLANQRGVNPGVELISPPTQHDMYSIEDLMRLIADIRALHPQLKTVSVKITSKPGIGAISVGIAKCGADKVVISGKGGTGAAKHSAIRNTGSPLELGLIEAFRSLEKSGMFDKVRLEVDGGIITGKDIIKLAILGSDEFGFGTSLLMAGEACIFCNKCPTDECPTGITTQDPEAAARLGFGAKANQILSKEDPLTYQQQFEASKESIKTYLKLVANEVRQLLASLGVKSLKELRGRVDLLERITRNDRTDKIDLDFIWNEKNEPTDIPNFGEKPISHREHINKANQIIVEAAERGNKEITIDLMQMSGEEDCGMRTIASTLVGKVVKKEITLPDGGFTIKLRGYPGQSLGFCLIDGFNIEVDGIARDFVGNSMCGGKIVIRPPEQLSNDTENPVNVLGASSGYGASGGKLYASGKAGQRFGVRSCKNALLVCEGLGKYGFEYMTGGTGVILTEDIGNELASGMSAGKIFIYNKKSTVNEKLNKKSVKMESLTDAEKADLSAIIYEFAQDTNSKVAGKILSNLNEELNNFVKIVPLKAPQPPESTEKGNELTEKMKPHEFVAKNGS